MYEGMTPSQFLMILAVATSDHTPDWHSHIQATLQHILITCLESLPCEIQFPQGIVLEWIYSRIINHQIRLGTLQQFWQVCSENSQVAVIIQILRKRHVQITVLFSEWEIGLAMHRKGKHCCFILMNEGGSITLVDIQIDDQDLLNQAFLEENPGRYRGIVEDTET